MRSTILILLLLVNYNAIHAQFGPVGQRSNLKAIGKFIDKKQNGEDVQSFHKLNISYGYTFYNTNFVQNLPRYSQFGQEVGRTEESFSSSVVALTGSLEYYFNIMRINNKSGVIFSINPICNVADLKQNYINAKNERRESLAAIAQVNMPLYFSYRSGGDYTLNKADNLSFTFGAGIAPYMVMSGLLDESFSSIKFGMRPALKIGLGFFTGINWGIEAQALLGTINITNYNNLVINNNIISSFYEGMRWNSGPQVSLSLKIFPFSFDWESDRW